MQAAPMVALVSAATAPAARALAQMVVVQMVVAPAVLVPVDQDLVAARRKADLETWAEHAPVSDT